MNGIEMYESRDGGVRLDVQLEGDTVRVTRQQMSQLFRRDTSTVSRHVRNVFAEGELDEERNLYQHVTVIYVTAIDYDPKSSITRTFFATV